MQNLIFFVKEASRALRRNAAPSIAAIVTVAITVLLVGVFGFTLLITNGKNTEVRDQIGIKVFMQTDASKAETKAVGETVKGTPHVEAVEFTSRREAPKVLKERGYGKSLTALNRNPLPSSFFIKPDDPDNIESIVAALQPPNAAGKPKPVSGAIDEITSSRSEALPIREATGGLKVWLLVIAALLIVTSLLLVGNTIRLSIYARRRDIEVMRLVGATSWFIRWPFVVEGVMVGLFGAAIACLFLWLGSVIVLDPLKENFKLLEDLSAPPLQTLIALLTLGSVVVAALGSGFTLRRFLRV